MELIILLSDEPFVLYFFSHFLLLSLLDFAGRTWGVKRVDTCFVGLLKGNE